MGQSTILIIDDEKDLVRLTTKRLQKVGYEVVCHFEGRGAVDAVRAAKPDLILLDIWLPDIDGIDIFKEIRGDEELKSIPIVLFSASVKEMDRRIQELDADGFVTKPYEPQALFETINRAMASRRGR